MEETGKNKLICELDVSERPREKAMNRGFESLSDAELMAIIFATGVKGKSVVDLCHEILDNNLNHLSLVTKKSVNELCNEHKGIGKVKAITLLAALELGKRAAEDAERLTKQEPINNGDVAYKKMRHHFQWLQHEEFWVLYINRAGQPIKEKCISRGGTAATTVDVKIILRDAIQCLASSMILYHNHPSGTLRPSIEDDRLTNKIAEGARLLDVRVVDHIIITDSGYYSYATHGKL